MASGHILDANTIGLWRMDEANAHLVGGVLSTGLSPKTLAGAPHVAFLVDYPLIAGAFCRYSAGNEQNSGGTRRFSAYKFTGDATWLASLKGSWTYEAFVRIPNTFGTYGNATNDCPLFCYGVSGATEAINIPINVLVTSAGKLKVNWESGVNVQHNFTATNVSVRDDAWHHVGISKDTATKELKFYLDGVLTDTFVYTTEPTGGSTTADVLMGVISDAASATAHGFRELYLRCVSISTVARDQAWMTAAAALMATTGLLVEDGSTRSRWCFDAAPCFLDSGPLGGHLLRQSGAGVGILSSYTDVNKGLIKDNGRAAVMNYMAFQAGYFEEWRAALLDEFTWEAWFQPLPSDSSPPSSPQGLFSFGGGVSGEGELQAMNTFSIYIATTLQISINWETGSGTENNRNFTSFTLGLGNLYHLAVRKRKVVNDYYFDLFVDGVLVETSAIVLAASNMVGMTMPCYGLGIGRSYNWNGTYGLMDDVRFSNIARIDDEILDSYQRGIGSIDAASPVISNISPADLIIRPETVISFDVTDDITLVYTGIIAKYPDGSQDVVYDGFEFGERFVPNGIVNTKTAIEGGFRFRVRRTGGWKKSPRLKPAVIDGAGNVGAIAS